jgi:hypothetical protein
MTAIVRPAPFLRQVLLLDAVVSGATGLLLLLGAGFLTGLLALPVELLRTAGLLLLPFVAFVAYIATRTPFSRAGVWAVIGVNALWVLTSIGLLLSGWVAPNGLGLAFIIAQALVVGLFAELQVVGLRRSFHP